MMRTHTVLAAAALLAACTGTAPRTPEVTPAAPPAPGPGPGKPGPDAPAPAGAPATPPQTPPPVAPIARVAKLDTGLSLVLTTVPPSHDAIVQFGLGAGMATQAPGLAELTLHALLASADPSRGRPALATAIANLGGTARVHAGMASTWLELRVPGPRWEVALQALREALDAPQQSRHQLERVRDDLVAATGAAIAADPLAAMAEQLLLGCPDTTTHCNDLIDRDASEIGTFLGRMLRPERCVLAVQAAATTEQQWKTLQRPNEGFGDWRPTTAATAAPPTLERPFPGGVHWATDDAPGPCRVALIAVLPDVASKDAAAALLLHACVTLDGTGGRFERLQQEHALGHVRWRSEIVQTPEAAALVLRAELSPTEAAAAWQTWNLARRSLGDVPPTAEERALAARRAPLSARLPLLDAGARGRTLVRLVRAERSLEALDGAFAALAGDGAALQAALPGYQALPTAMVVVGGAPPADLADVRTFRPLPAALAANLPGPAAATSAPDAANAAPWLARAIDAVGGAERLRRLRGWRCEAQVGNDRAPSIDESIDWNADGTLLRTRDVLGQTVTTTLRGNEWQERLGERTVQLEPREAELLRAQQRRHPLAMLAAHARGELPFRVVSQRNVGDRDLLVLEASGERGSRLRMHVDAESCLVRAVETWDTLADGAVVHVHDAWSDYRAANGLRAPFHRLSTQDDGQNRVETTFRTWTPRLQ